MNVRNKNLRCTQLTLMALMVITLAITLIPASAFAQSMWTFTMDAESQVPDKMQVFGDGASLSGTPATGGLTGSILVEYAAPIDATVDLPILSSNVAGGVLTITGGTALAQATVSINLNTAVASVTNGPVGAALPGGALSFDGALDSLANPGDKLVIQLSLDGDNLP